MAYRRTDVASLDRRMDALACACEPGSRDPSDLERRTRALAEILRLQVVPGTVRYLGCEPEIVVGVLRAAGLDAEAAPPDGTCGEHAATPVDLLVCNLDASGLAPAAADALVGQFCAQAERVLFSPIPLHDPAVADPSLAVPELWARLFARRGFFRELDTDPAFVRGPALLFSGRPRSVESIVAAYEAYAAAMAIAAAAVPAELERQRALESLLAKRERQLASVQDAVAASTHHLHSLGATLKEREREIAHLIATSVQGRVQRTRDRLARGAQLARRATDLLGRAPVQEGGEARPVGAESRPAPALRLDRPQPPRPPRPLRATVWVVILADGPADRLAGCIEAVARYTHPLCHLVLACRDADPERLARVRALAHDLGLREEVQEDGLAVWAPEAARLAAGVLPDYLALLRRGAIVAPGWVQRLVTCATSEQGVGLVAPLTVGRALTLDHPLGAGDEPTSAATTDTDAAVADIDLVPITAALVEQYGGQVYPRIEATDGPCLLIGREVLADFGRTGPALVQTLLDGTDGLPARARALGRPTVLADDVAVLQPDAPDLQVDPPPDTAALGSRHGERVALGVAAGLRTVLARERWLRRGRRAFAGRRLLLALPLGASRTATYGLLALLPSLRAMGIDARLVASVDEETALGEEFPHDLPFLPTHLDMPSERLFRAYDAVITSFEPGRELHGSMFAASAQAWYTTITTGIRAATATVLEREIAGPLAPEDGPTARVWIARTGPGIPSERPGAGQDAPISARLGWSVDLDLFRPRRRPAEGDAGPIRVGVVARDGDHGLSLDALDALARQIEAAGGGVVEPVGLVRQPDGRGREDRLRVVGTGGAVIGRLQRAALLNALDTLIDCAPVADRGTLVLEALATGALVLVSGTAGQVGPILDGRTGLVALDPCGADAARRLGACLADRARSRALVDAGLEQATEHPPERAAYALLAAAFGEPTGGAS
jgi:hypothetical protein